MAYREQRFYPWSEAGEGANNRKIQNASGAAANTSTTCTFGTTTTVRYILAKPVINNPTSAAPAYAQDFGWNILKTDMNETSNTPNRRIILAGNWTFQGVISASQPDGLSVTYGVQVRVHKRGSTGTLTGVANGESVFEGIDLNLDWTVTFAVPEIILLTDETIHIEYWVHGRGGGSTGILSQVVTFHLGTPPVGVENETLFDVATNGIRTRFDRSLSATMVGLVSLGSLAIKKAKSVVMIGVVTMNRLAAFHRAFSSTVPIIVTMSRLLIFHRTFSLTMVGVPSRVIRVKLPRNVTMLATPSMNRQLTLHRTFSRTIVGVSSMTRLLTLHRTFSRTMTGVASFVRNIIIRRAFSATMIGNAFGRIGVPFDSLPFGGVISAIPGMSRSRVDNR